MPSHFQQIKISNTIVLTVLREYSVTFSNSAYYCQQYSNISSWPISYSYDYMIFCIADLGPLATMLAAPRAGDGLCVYLGPQTLVNDHGMTQGQRPQWLCIWIYLGTGAPKTNTHDIVTRLFDSLCTEVHSHRGLSPHGNYKGWWPRVYSWT